MSKLPTVTITISGPHDSGRTTLAVHIQNYLRENGYQDVTVKDTKPLDISQKDNWPQRFARNRERPHVIEVRTVELPGAELNSVNPVDPAKFTQLAKSSVEQTNVVWPELGMELLEKGGTRKFIPRELDKVRGIIRGEVDGKQYSCAVDVFDKVWRP